MAKELTQEQIYISASLICSEYEKAANEACMAGDRNAGMVGFCSPMGAMKSSLETAEIALGGAGSTSNIGTSSQGLSSEEDLIDRDSDPTNQTRQDLGYEGSLSEQTWSACKDLFDPGRNFQGWNAVWEGGSYELLDYNFLESWDKALKDANLEPMQELLGDSVEEFFQECLSCGLAYNFNVQIQPINFLGEIEKLLKQLESLIDFMLDRLNPFSTLMSLCSLFEGIRWLCVPDLIIILMALQALLRKYGMSLINISLDWTKIVGPILKAILDPIVSALEQILSMIYQPIDCIIGVLSQAESIGQTLAKTIDVIIEESQGLANNIPGLDPDNDGAGNFFGSSAKWTPAPEVGVEGNLGDIVPSYETSPGAIGGKPPPKVAPPPPPPPPQAFANPGQFGKDDPPGIPLNPPSLTLTDKTTVESTVAQGLWKDISGIGKLIITLNDFKSWLKQLFDNIIIALKSLNKLLSGSLNLSVSKSGIMLLILDIASMIMLLAKLKLASCDDIMEDPERVRDLFKQEFAGLNVNWGTVTQNRIYGESSTGLYSGHIEVPDCTTGLSTDPRKQNEFVEAMNEVNKGINE